MRTLMEAIVALGKRYLTLFCGTLTAFGVLIATSTPVGANSAAPDRRQAPGRETDRGYLSAVERHTLAGDAKVDYVLRLDTLRAELGENVAFDVNLENAWPLHGFDVLISYDPSVLWTAGITASGTRSADFEYFDYEYDYAGSPGRVRIQGLCNHDGPGSKYLAPGSGPVARLLLRVSDDAAYAGMWIPVRFVTGAGVDSSANTLTAITGQVIDRGQIEFHDGWVGISALGPVKLGDINQNGVAIEVSDYVYFTNYFIDPYHYPLNSQQLAASDLNRDRVPATIADLVTLINMIVQGQHYQSAAGGAELAAGVRAARVAGGMDFSYDSDFDFGGLLVVLRSDDAVDLGGIQLIDNMMSYVAARNGGYTRVFIYSLDGEVLPAGQRRFLSIAGTDDLEIVSVDAAAADGTAADIWFADSDARLPHGFSLAQNYPNPFNPDTRIGFSLAQASDVTLEVLDILGRRVNTLAEGGFAAGDHEVTWDGRNSRGEAVASGVYFYRLQTDDGSLTRKMMLMK